MLIVKNKSIKLLFEITLIILLVLASHSIDTTTKKPLLSIPMQEKALNVNKEIPLYFNMGLKRLLTSILWVQTMMDSDIDHYKSRDLNSWLFLRFDLITDLDPKFYLAYYVGGQYLSVIKDDVLGAKTIYEKGLLIFPNDFWLNYLAAFNYYWELKNCSRAYELYNRIKDNPLAKTKTHFLPSLIARMSTCQGDLESAYLIIKQSWEDAPENTYLKSRFHQYLYAIKAEIDLNCLNSKQNKMCDLKDQNDDFYTRDVDGTWIAKTKWIPFRAKFRNKN